jgi:hypothetical protein
MQQYETCRVLLEDELGVEPMEETRALYIDLMKTAVGRTEISPPSVAAAALKSTRIGTSLRAAAQKLDEARDAVAQALRAAESDDV